MIEIIQKNKSWIKELVKMRDWIGITTRRANSNAFLLQTGHLLQFDNVLVTIPPSDRNDLSSLSSTNLSELSICQPSVLCTSKR